MKKTTKCDQSCLVSYGKSRIFGSPQSAWTLMALLMLFSLNFAFAQKSYVPFAFSKANTAVQKMCTSVDESGWLYLSPETAFTAKDFIQQNRAVLGFGQGDDVQAGSEYNDEYGNYYWFHHYYKGIPIQGSAFMLSEKEGIAGSLVVTAIKNGSQASASRSITYVCPTCRTGSGQGPVELDNTNSTTNNLKLNLSPNPSKGVLNISIESLEDESSNNKFVKIFDLQGKKVYETSFIGETSILSVENLINGMYILQISSASQSTVGKFIINK